MKYVYKKVVIFHVESEDSNEILKDHFWISNQNSTPVLSISNKFSISLDDEASS